MKRDMLDDRKNKRNMKCVRNLWMISSLILLLLSLFMIGKTLYGLKKESAYFEVLALTAAEEEKTGKILKSGNAAWKGQKEEHINYQKLVAQNDDFFGWIKIDDTSLDYPVMYSPDSPNFYLFHDFDKNKSISGVPFVDGECSKNGGIYMIYGHNMKNGSMFHVILKYKDFDFWQQHKKIVFNTTEEENTYEVVSAFYSEVYQQDQKNVFRFYDYKDLSDEDTFYEFISNVQKNSLYETGITPVYGEGLLVLVTCSYHTEEGRFVVVARHVQEQE